MPETTRSFHAMGTEVLAIVGHPAGCADRATAALGAVEALFLSVESRLSRFRPDSELAWLNRSQGRPFAASDVLFEVVSMALDAASASGGLFDPTLIDALEGAGYDRSFELLAAPGRSTGRPRQQQRAARARWRQVRLSPAGQMIRLPLGCRLDLGGIGKGWTVDRAAALLRASGFRDFAVDAGGDLYVAGTQGDGSPWTVGVQDPVALDQDLLTVALADRAIATSSLARRTWEYGGRRQHHLIDPRTGAPADSGVLAATVVADSVARAEILAKVALLLGPRAGLDYLDAQDGAEGMLVLEDRHAAPSSGFPRVVAA